MAPVLQVKNITKKFSGVTALDDVSLELNPGKLTALIGENGAGKSTLLKIMSGIHTSFDGEIILKGSPIRFEKPSDAQKAGIAIIHQELNLIDSLTIAQNIYLGREIGNELGWLDEKAMHDKTRKLLQRLQLDLEPNTQVNSLKVGQQQIVEIAKALLEDSDVLFMDEPTSAIGEGEVEILFELINKLREEGKSIVYISHKLDELFTLADDYVVLRDGQLVGTGLMKDINRDQLVDLMAGRKVQLTERAERQLSTEVVLATEGLSLRNPADPNRAILNNINLQIRRGEVLGIYGLMGAGRTELCECLFGLHAKYLDGVIRLNDEPVAYVSPIEAIKDGLALVPEDRKRDAIVPELSVVKNMSLTDPEKIEKAGFINNALETKLYDKHVAALKIKVDKAEQLIKNLSGGNQQKVVLAKWIERNPKLLMLDEPTRGIDVNAKNEIYQLISNLADQGISILVVSSEIPEILSIADRILVMAEGNITAEFERKEATETKIMNACIPEQVTP
ncbi:MAG: sugar ABC transporter ATP-binding protein [Cyclobacteriaceae bacterium]